MSLDATPEKHIKHTFGNWTQGAIGFTANALQRVIDIAATPVNATANIVHAAQRAIHQIKNPLKALQEANMTPGEKTRATLGHTALVPVSLAKEGISATAVNAGDVVWQNVLNVGEFGVNTRRRGKQIVQFRKNKEREPFQFDDKTRNAIKNWDANARGWEELKARFDGINFGGPQPKPLGA